jgi:integrase
VKTPAYRLYQRPRSPFYYVDFWSNGVRVQKSTGQTDIIQAHVKARQMISVYGAGSEEELGAVIAKYLRTRVRDGGLGAYNAQRKILPLLTRFGEFTGVTRIDAVTPAHVDRWRKDAIKRGLKLATVYQQFRDIRVFFKWCVEHRLVGVNPCDSIKVEPVPAAKRDNWVSREDVARLLANAPTDTLKFVLHCGFDAGMRANEIIMARPVWFDMDLGLIRIPGEDDVTGFRPKSRKRDAKGRAITIRERFKKFLLESSVLKGEFCLAPHKPWKPGSLNYRYNFKHPLREYLASQGVKCSPHDMRRSFASNLAMDGVPIQKIAAWLGDSFDVTNERYAWLEPVDADIERGT